MLGMVEGEASRMTTDLLGHEIATDLFGSDKPPKRGKHYTQPKGYAGKPGTGPEGETCGSCKHCDRQTNYSGNKRWIKCELARAKWTGGRGSDILARAPACDKWQPQE